MTALEAHQAAEKLAKEEMKKQNIPIEPAEKAFFHCHFLREYYKNMQEIVNQELGKVIDLANKILKGGD